MSTDTNTTITDSADSAILTAATKHGFTPDADGHYTMEAAKKLGLAGMKFTTPLGSKGVILSERSEKGKLRAELTCIKGGPNHIREQSDWHQCAVSPEMKKGSGRKPAAKKATAQVIDVPEVTPSPEQVIANAESIRAKLQARLAEARARAGVESPTKAETEASV
jgi:hypothetical protein